MDSDKLIAETAAILAECSVKSTKKTKRSSVKKSKGVLPAIGSGNGHGLVKNPYHLTKSNTSVSLTTLPTMTPLKSPAVGQPYIITRQSRSAHGNKDKLEESLDREPTRSSMQPMPTRSVHQRANQTLRGPSISFEEEEKKELVAEEEEEWENKIAQRILTLYKTQQSASSPNSAKPKKKRRAPLSLRNSSSARRLNPLPTSPNNNNNNNSSNNNTNYLPSPAYSPTPKGFFTSTSRFGTSSSAFPSFMSPTAASSSPTFRMTNTNASFFPQAQLPPRKRQPNIILRKSEVQPIWFGGSSVVSERAVWCGLAEDNDGPSRRPLLSNVMPHTNEDNSATNLELPNTQRSNTTATTTNSNRRSQEQPHERWLACSHSLCTTLAALEAKQNYKKYVAMVEGLLSAKERAEGKSDVLKRQWRQLCLICCLFADSSCRHKDAVTSLFLLKRVDYIAERHLNKDTPQAKEVLAISFDHFSHHYFQRNKPSAALQYSVKAMRQHYRLNQAVHVAKCHLHSAAALSVLKKPKEAVACLTQVLEMLETNQLEEGASGAYILSLVAVCYHNLAVEQYRMKKMKQACQCSQNARRLARLSLSFSTQWLSNFEATHNACLTGLSIEQETNADNCDGEMMTGLSSQLYD